MSDSAARMAMAAARSGSASNFIAAISPDRRGSSVNLLDESLGLAPLGLLPDEEEDGHGRQAEASERRKTARDPRNGPDTAPVERRHRLLVWHGRGSVAELAR